MKQNMTSLTRPALAAGLLAIAQPALAQPFAIDWSTIDAGGTTTPLTGGPFQLVGTIGQPDADTLTGGPFTLTGGFWHGTHTPACVPDLTGSVDPNNPDFGVPDGLVDANDFFYYLILFAAADPAADLTGSIDPNNPAFGIPDGTIDANDFFFYLTLFAAGCP